MIGMVALLRSVNVGGRGRLAMADLRKVAVGLGYERVRTYIQSGNLLFAAAARDPTTVAVELESALARSTSVRPLVVVRTADEMAQVVERNPFAHFDQAKVHVVFVSGPAETGLDDLDRYAPEAAAVMDREIFLYLPDGVGRSRLAVDIGRRGTPGTMRNWRTVSKLAEMSSTLV